jgi:Sulfatase-modifying factor enzyme 1
MSQTPTNQNESLVLIVDTSSSANSCWDETRLTAQRIYFLLAGSRPLTLFTLGNHTQVSPDTLEQTTPPGFTQKTSSCSLIAPIMESLTRQAQKHSLIVVGNGEIFDLQDWADAACVDGWLLVRTGEQSLQADSGTLPEIAPEQIRTVSTLLSYFNSFSRQPADDPEPADDRGSYQWQVDPSGYPLIRVDPLGSFVHLFPITKPQFERFMVSGKSQGYDDLWYTEILRLNPRASYRSEDIPLPEQLFMTGITTDEAAAFSKWMGRDYTLLSAEEWRKCHEWFATQPAICRPAALNDRLARDARATWAIIDDQCRYQRQRPTLRELSLMTGGILEWVVERPGRYCGLGEPALSEFQRKAFDPVHPLGPEPRRLKNLGFRLCARSF